MMVLSYSITKGIGIGIISYVIVSTIIFVVDLIKYSISKNKENLEKPKYDVSIVAIIIFALFMVYFLVPVVNN